MPRPARTQISRFRWAVLFAEQGGRCAGCMKPLCDDTHLDHVIPLSGGGEDRFENMQLLHGSCNLEKRALGAQAWFALTWRRYLLTCRPVEREHVTVALEVELAERLRLAAYWSKRSIADLMKEGAGLVAKRVEDEGARTGLRLRSTRIVSAGSSVAPTVNEHRWHNGDLFSKPL